MLEALKKMNFMLEFGFGAKAKLHRKSNKPEPMEGIDVDPNTNPEAQKPQL